MIAGKFRQLAVVALGLSGLVVTTTWAEPLPDAERRALAVASYDGGAVTVGEIEDSIADSSPLIQATALEPDSLRGFVDRHLRFELQLKEAERRGYRESAEVRKSAKDNAVKLLLARDVDAPVRAEPASEQALRAYFESHREAFSVREKRRASALFVATEAEARALLPQVKASNESTLRELVQARGLDVPSKARGGALGSFDAKGAPETGDVPIDPKLARAAYALPAVGAVSDVIELAADSFAILKLTEVRPGSSPPFEEVQVRVSRRVDDERYEQAVDAITTAQRERLKPVVHYELLDALRIE